MATISEIFRTFSPEYVDRFGDSMPQEHRKAMNAIIGCRTEAAGIAVYECQECGELHRVQILWESPLSNLPESQNQPMAAKTDATAASRTPFHDDLHRSRRIATLHTIQPAGGLFRPVHDLIGRHQKTGQG